MEELKEQLLNEIPGFREAGEKYLIEQKEALEALINKFQK